MPALKVESLEGVMKSVTFDMKNLILWPKLERCSCPSFFLRHHDMVKGMAQNSLFHLLHKLMHESPYE